MTDRTFYCANHTPPRNSPRVKRLYGSLRLTVRKLPAVADNYRGRVTYSASKSWYAGIRRLPRQGQDS